MLEAPDFLLSLKLFTPPSFLKLTPEPIVDCRISQNQSNPQSSPCAVSRGQSVARLLLR